MLRALETGNFEIQSKYFQVAKGCDVIKKGIVML